MTQHSPNLGHQRKIQRNPSFEMEHCMTVPSYLNISKRCLLCLHEKSENLFYPSAKLVVSDLCSETEGSRFESGH